MNIVFVIACNAGGRPTVMHELKTGIARRTLCGRVMEGRSLCYVPESVARGSLKAMACGSCGRGKVEG